MNQNFIHFFTKTDIHIKEYKRKSQRFIKFYTSRLVKSLICDQEYFNANLYTNLLSDKDALIQKRIEDLTSLECVNAMVGTLKIQSQASLQATQLALPIGAFYY